MALACDKLAELVKKKTNGKMIIKTFHGGQLGSGKETFEGRQDRVPGYRGRLLCQHEYPDPVLSSLSIFPIFLKPVISSWLPSKTRKSGGKVDDTLKKVGLKWLLALEYAPRQIGTSKKAIKTPADLKGLKLRASRSPLEIATHKAWGATGVTIDWPSVPEALRMGLVDGETVGYDSMVSAKHYVDSIRYVTELNFQSYGCSVVVNSKWWAKLPAWAKKALDEAAMETMKWHEAMFAGYVNKAKKTMIDAGVKVYVPDAAGQKAFRDIAKKKVWPEFVGKTIDPKFVKLIQKECGKPAPGPWFK